MFSLDIECASLETAKSPKNVACLRLRDFFLCYRNLIVFKSNPFVHLGNGEKDLLT